jgi:hypothetical protein
MQNYIKKVKLICAVFFITLNVFGQSTGYQCTPLSSGLNNNVICQAVYNNELYVGGVFTTAGGVNTNCIAKWNGSNWTSVGSGISTINTGTVTFIRTMMVYNNELYVGGSFNLAGGVNVNGLAKWNGTTWSAVGSSLIGPGGTAFVSSLEILNNELYVGGMFTYAGALSVNNIAKWNGSNWFALGTGVNYSTSSPFSVIVIKAHNNEIYISVGNFSAGGVNANNIAKWDGNNLATLGTGLNNAGYALASYNNELYVGGAFTSAGGINASGIAKWDGTNWSAVDNGIANATNPSPSINCLAVHGSNLYAGGNFNNIGTGAIDNIARLNGTWQPVGSGTNGAVYSLGLYNGELHAGGAFTTALGVNANYIVKIYQVVPEPSLASSNIQFTSIATNSLSLAWTNGNGKKHLVVAHAGTAVNQVPLDLIPYNANNFYGTGSDLGNGNYVVYGGTGNNVTVNNLNPDVIYHFAIYDYNDSTVSGFENYLISSFPTASHTTIALEPTTPTGSFTFSNQTLNSMTVTVTPGNGTQRIIIAKQGSFVNNTALVDTMAYLANSTFGTGPVQGAGNYIVYNGTGTTFNLTGLTPNLPYYFASYEYNGSTSAANNYLIASPSTGMQGSLNSEPTLQPSAIAFTNVTENSMTLSWTNGDGTNRIIIARTSTVNAAPTDGVDYIANSTFSLGDNLGLNNYVVYSGTSNTVNLTGLNANTTYYFAIYEYNGTNTSNNYLIPGPATGFQSTLFSEPLTPATNLTLSTITSGITNVSWVNGSGSNRLVVVREGLPLNQLPDDGNGYIANSTFASGTDLGSGNFICFAGNTNSFNLQGLNSTKVYYICVIEYNGAGTNSNYLTSNFPIANNLPFQPSLAASSLMISQNSNTSASLSWINGDGGYRILIGKANAIVNETPIDGTVYTANSTFGSGANLGTNNFVLYSGTGNSTVVNGLDTNNTYHFALYEFNKDLNGPPNYLETPNLIGNISIVALTSGLNELENELLYSISPNPFTEQSTLVFSKEQKKTTIKILNMLGKEIKVIEFTGQKFTLEKGELEAGVYVLQTIDKDKKVCNRRFVIQ